jgi:hypothetical protein
MMRYVMAAEGVSDTMKAATVAGITMMSKADFERFSALADKGLAYFRTADYDGLLKFLEEEAKAPPDIVALARSLIGAYTTGSPHPL